MIRRFLFGLGVCAAAGGCVADAGLMVILQNQQPSADSATGLCSAPSTPTAVAVGAGVLDLDTGGSPGYFAYPLVQSRLPSRATTPGGADANTIYLDGVRGTLFPPPGLTHTFAGDCPATFFAASAATLLPGTTQPLTAQIIRPCLAAQIRELFATGQLPPDLNQQVLFTAELRASGRLASGDELLSDAFRLSIRMCIGCLQTGFLDTAQFNFPNRPPCTVAPKPNAHHGNPCNVAQDFGPLLCCTDDSNQVICPAPDT